MTIHTLNKLQQDIASLTCDLISFPSTEVNSKARDQCIQYIKNYLNPLESIKLHDFPSLLAVPNDVDKPDILFCGHLDIVHHLDQTVYRSIISDGCIHGPGAGDMKGGLAIMLKLFKEFNLTHGNLSLGLVITSDEEIGGYSGIRYLVEEIGLRCGVTLIPDGGSLSEVVVEEKGIIHLRLDCKGKETHAARP